MEFIEVVGRWKLNVDEKKNLAQEIEDQACCPDLAEDSGSHCESVELKGGRVKWLKVGYVG